MIFFVMTGMGAFGYNFQTLLPLITKRVLLAGPSTLSLLFAVMGAGSVVAGLVAAYRAKPSQRLLLGHGACFVVLLALKGSRLGGSQRPSCSSCAVSWASSA